MSAHVPYLARLASRAVGPAPLQPPRPLFPGTAYLAGRLLAADDAEDFPRGQAVGTGPGGPAVRAGATVAPARTDRPGLTPVMPGPTLAPPLAPQPQQAQQARATMTPPAPTLAAPAEPREPLPPAGPVPPTAAQPPARPPASPARGRAPGAPASGPSRGTPARRPDPVGLASVTSQASTRPAPAPTPGPRADGPGPADALTAGQRQPGGGSSHRAADGRDAGRDPGPSPVTAANSVLPPRALAPRPDELTGPGPSGPRQQLRGGPGPTRVSIGTIEVTVVPPARPALRASDSRLPAQLRRDRSRPPSLLAATAEASRLRNGIRRWYGIAQG